MNELPIFIQIMVYVIVIGAFVGLVYCGYRIEKRAYNGGICPKCGCPLTRVETDSQGCNKYQCVNCDHYVWVCHGTIDKDFKERINHNETED